MNITRREFLRSVTAATLYLWLDRLGLTAAAAAQGAGAPAAAALPDYRGWEDVYRRTWCWDSVTRSSHFVNCWYQAHCSWDVYVKDGVVWREEQAADYPRVRSDTPDFNPRGCQKGACFSSRMYDPTRVKYPLKRIGERGSGKWQRISWQQALEEIADRMIETITEEGSDRVIWSLGPLYTFGPSTVGQLRLLMLLDSCQLDMNTEIGDTHPGAAVTFGKIVAERSLDDFFFSDVILIWGSNPLYTQIPNAHFWTEARYKGAYVVTIAPDYSASAVHADEWVTLRPGTDAALGLSLSQVIVSENLHDQAFLREQTDMPCLVRDDNGRFLRQSDIEKGGSADVLYLYDTHAKAVVECPRESLALGDVVPALEGVYEANTLSGPVKVRPVFALLRESLDQHYKPEQTAATTGVSAQQVRDLARRIGKAKAVSNVTSSNISKYYHGNLMERAQILVFALCGHMGKRGSGYSAFPFLNHDAVETFAMMRERSEAGQQAVGAQMQALMKQLQQPGVPAEMARYNASHLQLQRGLWVCGVLFWNIHGGLLEASGRSQEWDPHMKRPLGEYLKESLDKGYQFVWPKPGNDPRVIFEMGGNILRRLRGYPFVLKTLYPKLKAYITIDWRMTSTGLFSDYLLPAAGWYEKAELKWITPLMPYLHAGSSIVKPLEESKPEWEICALLAKTIQERAKARKIAGFKDRWGNERTLEKLYEEFTMQGAYDENDNEKVTADMVNMSTNLGGTRWETLKKKGYARYTGTGNDGLSAGNACDIEPDDTIIPFQHHVEGKLPYPTLTRRIQFYIDHPFYIELGESLPVHKDPPIAGGNHPLTLTGGHTRWSIHSAWRDFAPLLRLQRGTPVMYMSTPDAEARGIRDGELVEVRNDIDSFRINVKTSVSVRPGQLIIYHAWENYQFPGGKGFQNLIPSPINPVELAGGEGHLRPYLITSQPYQNDRDTRVEVTRVSA